MKIYKFFPDKECLLWIVGLVVLFLVLSTGKALAQAPSPSDDEVNRIASQLYCPICDNISLDVCPLEACQAWRDLIREQLVEGWTEQEIIDYFVAQYGDRVSGEPPRSGLNWILYLVPPTIILAGLVLLISKMKRPTQQQVHLNREPEDRYIQQVERDLDNLD